MVPTPLANARRRSAFKNPGRGTTCACGWPVFGIRISDFYRASDLALRISLSFALLLAGCSGKESPAQRATAAKALFERATKEYHLPSAEAKGAAQRQLQDQAAATYEQLLRKYPEQTNWCVQALYSLGNIRAAQTNLDAAIRFYSAVGERYPQQDWEVLMAWKSAGDQLWEAGRKKEAKGFYEKIVARFDNTNAPAVVKTVVLGSRSHLAE
jgi:tetratricopeptide (TPR) repeat protein